MSRETIPQRMKRWLVSLSVLLPDERKHWAGRAALSAIRKVRRDKIGYVLTSAPPFSVHFIGFAAKVLTGVRWFADFRDPWIDMLWDRSLHTRSRLSDILGSAWKRWSQRPIEWCTTPRCNRRSEAGLASLARNSSWFRTASTRANQAHRK